MKFSLCFTLYILHHFTIHVAIAQLILFFMLLLNSRMSIEMVACIAIEAISILEKMHSRGWGVILFFLLVHWFCLFPFYLVPVSYQSFGLASSFCNCFVRFAGWVSTHYHLSDNAKFKPSNDFRILSLCSSKGAFSISHLVPFLSGHVSDIHRNGGYY